MKYDVDRFYKISAFFNDEFRFMARVIELRLGVDRKRANKELLHGRYKPEYLDVLDGVIAELKTDPMKPYKEAVLATIPKTDVSLAATTSQILRRIAYLKSRTTKAAQS